MIYLRTGNKNAAAAGSERKDPDRVIFEPAAAVFCFTSVASETSEKVSKTPEITVFFDFY